MITLKSIKQLGLTKLEALTVAAEVATRAVLQEQLDVSTVELEAQTELVVELEHEVQQGVAELNAEKSDQFEMAMACSELRLLLQSDLVAQ